MPPRILLLDIETSPNTAYVWGLFKQNISIHNVIGSGSVICWAAKWLGEDKVMFRSNQTGHKRMLREIHKLLDQADAIIHYNGTRFDIPTLNKEFLLQGWAPPSPAKQIDLYRVVRSRFRFVSNKLDYVAGALGVGNKTKHAGFQMWIDCMAGDKDAWKEMEKYNRNDVTILEAVYFRLLPWIKSHLNLSLLAGDIVCPNCGSGMFQRRGYNLTLAGKYQRYQCNDCGNWFQAGKSVAKLPAEKAKNI